MIARTLAIAAIAAGALSIAAPALASSPSTGAAMTPFPVCRSTPAEPGHAYTLSTNGNIPGAQVTDSGSGGEDLALSTGPSQWKQLPGMPVPASWISFSYPKLLYVISQSHVSLSAGASTSIPVTLTVPANAARGTYVTGLIASTGTGSGNVQMGAAAEVPLIFTVGISRPDWTRQQLADAGNCWIAGPKLSPWQQAMGTTYPDPPPGWHQTAGSWVYDPPPGWLYTFANTSHQVYRGGLPAVQCVNPASYPAPGGGDEIGGNLPVTSTASGCAAWLAASKAGTLGREPAVSGTAPELDAHLAVAAAAAKTKKGSGAVVVGLVVLVIILAAGRAWWRHLRKRQRRGQW